MTTEVLKDQIKQETEKAKRREKLETFLNNLRQEASVLAQYGSPINDFGYRLDSLARELTWILNPEPKNNSTESSFTEDDIPF